MDSIEHRFDRNRRIFGTEGVLRLMKKPVAVFGIGGVGGHAAEALVRSGIGAIDLIDGDRVSVSNINRQIVALSSTVGDGQGRCRGKTISRYQSGSQRA